MKPTDSTTPLPADRDGSELHEAKIWKAQFDQLKAEHVKRGMTPEQADEQAYRDIKRQIWKGPI